MSFKVMVLSGSARNGSNTKAISDYVHRTLQEKEIDVSFMALNEHSLPVFNGESEQSQVAEVAQLRDYAAQANGFFIVTPEYHNGISGALKNALDFLGDSHFRGKPIAIAAAAGGGKGGINALNNLRLILRGLYGVVLPEQYIADPNQINEKGELSDQEAKARLSLLMDDIDNELKKSSEQVLSFGYSCDMNGCN